MGVFWYYMIFVVGTAISSILIYRLDDDKVEDEVDKLEEKYETSNPEGEIELANL